MELYTLDTLFRRVEVIDRYESCIWTERRTAYGDLELKMHSTAANRSLLKTGTHLAQNESVRVMTVETIEDAEDDEGRSILTITGRSLEQILDERVARDGTVALTSDVKWVFDDLPAEIARWIFHQVCVVGALDPGDIIPMVNESSIFPDDTLSEYGDPVPIELDLVTVYVAIKQICDLYDLGFRLVRSHESNQLYFDIYAGSDRTTQQTILDPVVFSAEMDNMQNTTELTTIAPNRNCAYVFSPVGTEIVYPIGVDPEVESFERRVLMVRADDITDTDPGVASTKMIQRGLDELAQNRSFYAFDGELRPNNGYKYGKDYYLGDVVELRNSDGLVNNMRITEQIFVSDAEGERSYPTLAIDIVIEPGSWLSWDYSQVWEDLDDDFAAVWSNQP
jgi:hypothetical protein